MHVRRHLRIGIAAGLVAATLGAPGPTATAGGGGHPRTAANDPAVITQWNAVAMGVLTPSGRPLTTQPFVLTAMHVAIYDAVVAIEGGARPFGTRITAARGASSAAAAAAAAHRVLVGFLPASSATFDAALAESLAAIPDGQGETDGVAVGEAAGWGTLAYRLGDGSQSGPPWPVPAPGPGVWAPTPPATGGLAPWLKDAKPYTMRSNDQFRPDGPPALDSKRYERALDEVRRIGGATSTERTAAQTEAARFWGDQPIAQGQRALRGKATQLDWDIVATARLYAAILTSQADAFIACWDAKYHYAFWRPWQSVPLVEPGWTPLIPTPSHPEYPSAHGCATGAMAYTLSELLGTDAIDLTVDAASIGVTHHFATRDDLIREVGDARIWGGIHYRFSVDAGVRIAERVVKLNLSRNFRMPGHHG